MTLAAAAAFTVVFVAGSGAVLSPSTFEGNDGNLLVNTSGNTDWCNQPIATFTGVCPSGSLVSGFAEGIDQPSGPSDNSFGQGTKEDNPNATIVTGSIPPNKNDLTRFYIGSEFVNNQNFLYLGWERSVNIGNANLDLEINQNATAGFTGTTTGPITLNRTAGDLLVTYDFSGSGTPTLGLLFWVTSGSTSQCFASNTLPCWGNRIDLSAASAAEGAVNTSSVIDPINPNAPRTLTTGLFGEASINLTAAGVFPTGTCKAFGSTFLKSRSSSAFGAEVKDFIAPQPVNISNCGTLIVKKVTDPSPDPTNTSFSFTKSEPGGANTGKLPRTFSLTNGQSDTETVFAANDFSVSETVPANWMLTSASCDNGSGTLSDSTLSGISVAPDETVTCTFNDKLLLGAIKVVKTAKNKNLGSGDQPQSGVTFTVVGPGSSTTSHTITTDSTGTACVDGLAFGSYTVTETVPSGYKSDSTNPQTTDVETNTTCAGTPNSLTFHNIPLSTITLGFHSLAGNGVTTATVQCTGEASPADLPQGDATKTLGDSTSTLTPGTYSCTVVIDP